MSSLDELSVTPVSTQIAANGPPIPEFLSNVATFQRDSVPTNLNQTNIQPVYDIYASAQGRDLGGISQDICKISPSCTAAQTGQHDSSSRADPEHAGFVRDLGVGLLFASVFVYLLMVVNYQNFGDPFAVILALPATLVGILTMLFITGTTLNVPSLMGAIMAVGRLCKLNSSSDLRARAATQGEERVSSRP